MAIKLTDLEFSTYEKDEVVCDIIKMDLLAN